MLIGKFRRFGSVDVPGISSSTRPLIFYNASKFFEIVGKGVAAFLYALKSVPASLRPFRFPAVKCLWDTARYSGIMNYNICGFQKYSKVCIRYLQVFRST